MSKFTYSASKSENGEFRITNRERVVSWRIIRSMDWGRERFLVASGKGPMPENMWVSCEFNLEWDEE